MIVILLFTSYLVPPSFSIKPTSQKARIGDDVSLDCVAIGDPVPTQKWDKDGRQLVLGKYSKTTD